ncbi:mechanosensitive ion channel domain-containing protein [Uliginosibacterium sp. H3]|uniref:Small-conductance mechanosensitive channel n=1 Tax=Uliginosibacterium silvisoli TaxID=3114758 RepID=A0ABU6K407_9RHOO|nr:mechanosensitive ion channel domain-containing protein [Uliginosibacterium sp. H3]
MRFFIPLLFRLFLMLLVPIASAAEAPLPTSQATPATAVSQEGVPVKVLNRQIAVFRAPLFGVTPAERARRTSRRIGELLAHAGAGVVTTQLEPQGNVLFIDGSMAIVLGPDDVDKLSGETLDSATQAVRQALADAIAETHESRDRGRQLTALWRSALATVFFLAIAWVVLRFRRAVVDRTTALLTSRADAVHVAGAPIIQASWLQALVRWLVRAAVFLVLAIALYEWLSFVLTQFAYTRPWGEALGSYLFSAGEQLGLGILHALPDLFVAVLIFLLARFVTAALGPVFDRVERGQGRSTWLDKDTAAPTRKIVNIGIWLFALVMAYPYLPGAGSEAFKGVSVLVGLMITIGGSSLMGQGASGLILMYSKTLRVGEYVRINDHEGTVIELGTFTTKIRTGLGEELAMPNAVVLGTTTKNYSRAVKGSGYVLDTVVTIGYDTPWRQVREMLIDAADLTEGVLADPKPRVFKTALSDFYVEYRLVCQAVPSQPRPRAEVLDLLHANILDVFNEQGVQIMSPHYLGDPDTLKVTAPDDPYAAPKRTNKPPASA